MMTCLAGGYYRIMFVCPSVKLSSRLLMIPYSPITLDGYLHSSFALPKPVFRRTQGRQIKTPLKIRMYFHQRKTTKPLTYFCFIQSVARAHYGNKRSKSSDFCYYDDRTIAWSKLCAILSNVSVSAYCIGFLSDYPSLTPNYLVLHRRLVSAQL